MKALLSLFPSLAASFAQFPEALDVSGKLGFHVKKAVGPEALLGLAAYAAVLQAVHSPNEWKEGSDGYGKRVASMVAWSGIHGALAFGLDSTLHQDPRYYRLAAEGFWRRPGHAIRGTFLTRTDSGGETLSTSRLGSVYGSSFLSNMFPHRLNTVRLGFLQGSLTMGFELAGNLGAEFWPDIKRKVFHRK